MKSPFKSPLTCYSYYANTNHTFFYAFGNSIPEDLFAYHHNQTDLLSGLLLGSGDIRNMLFSISDFRTS